MPLVGDRIAYRIQVLEQVTRKSSGSAYPIGTFEGKIDPLVQGIRLLSLGKRPESCRTDFRLIGE